MQDVDVFDRYPMVFPLAQCLCVVTMKRRVEPHLDLNVVQQWPDTRFIWVMGTWDQFTCCHFASRYLFQEVFSPTHPHHKCISIQPSCCLQPVPFSCDFPITHSYRIWTGDRSSSWSWSQMIDEQKLSALWLISVDDKSLIWITFSIGRKSSCANSLLTKPW